MSTKHTIIEFQPFPEYAHLKGTMFIGDPAKPEEFKQYKRILGFPDR